MGTHSTRNRRLFRLVALVLFGSLFTTACAGAPSDGADSGESAGAPDGYPKRPIELNVVYPAGGGMDVTARALAASAKEFTGDEFRVVNREGAGGLVGHTFLAKQARTDGYELGVIAVDFLVFDVTLRDAEFGQDDFAPLAFIAFEPVVQVVRADSNLGDKNFDEIIDNAKANPGELRVGVIPNTTFDVFTKVVSNQTGAEFTTVPFDGGKPGVTALLSGDLDITNAFYSEVQPYIDSGDLVPIAISDNTPYEALPDVPTMSDLGIDVPDTTFGAGRMVVAPADMDPAFQEHLAELFVEVMSSDSAIEQFQKVGAPLAPAGIDEARELYKTAFDELPASLKLDTDG